MNTYTQSLIQLRLYFFSLKYMNSTNEEIINISGLGINGEGIGRLDSLALFVEGALPKELVLVDQIKFKQSYAKARLKQIISPSSERVEPICPSFSTCGGCQIMHLGYEAQLKYKTQLVKDAIFRIANVKDFDIKDCLSSPKKLHYRNKIQLPVSLDSNNSLIFGFYEQGSHNIVKYDKCFAHNEMMENCVKSIAGLVNQTKIKIYNEKNHQGSLRHIIIRSNEANEALIGLISTGQQSGQFKRLAHLIMDRMPQVVGVVESINTKRQNSILGEAHRLLVGQDFLLESLDGLKFKLSLPSFFQVNKTCAQILYKTALDFAEIQSHSKVLDAYCGIGTMSLLAAKKAALVLGIESVPSAIENAKENARINNINNASFINAKMEDKLSSFKDIDITLINPPRKGLDSEVSLALNHYGPKTLVYISCNPATLARDLKILSNYRLIKVQPVDMFPQTMHVECVAQLKRSF